MKLIPILTLFLLLFYQLGAKPRNVLIIQTDEHNFRTLGCYRDLMSNEQAYVWGEGVKVTRRTSIASRRKGPSARHSTLPLRFVLPPGLLC